MALWGSILRREMVAPVAASWLREAAGFGVWRGDELLAYWPEPAAGETVTPESVVPGRPDLRALVPGLDEVLTLGVVGNGGPLSQARLDADASLIARVAHGEIEIASMIESALVQREQAADAAARAEMARAAGLQARLLPRRWPPTPGLDVFAGMRPGEVVGGDFYDVMRLGPTVFACVGDVSAQGPSATLAMAMTRAALRGAVAASPAELDRALRAGAEVLYADLAALETFASAFLATYDVRTRELTYINAGQAPVVLRRADGETTIITTDEPPLGMLPTAASAVHRVTLGPGDAIVAATDGISESVDARGAWFGFDRFVAAIEQAHHGSAREIAGAIFDATGTFRGQPASDDQTILVLKGGFGTTEVVPSTGGQR